jgi:hypothetical protein
MNARLLGLATLAALLALPVSAATQPLQQTAGSHVQVTWCHPHIHTAAQRHPWIDVWGRWHPGPFFPYWDAFLGVSFRNTAPVVATEIDFGLVARGYLVDVARDVGTFSPGVLIEDHEFTMARDVFPLGTAYPFCEVLRVKYANGTVWENPHPTMP